MRLLDWGQHIDDADYSPTMFDDIVIRVGDKFYELADFEVLVKGGDDGPGVVAYVAGSEIPELTKG